MLRRLSASQRVISTNVEFTDVAESALVGPPGFEPGTSCTPRNSDQSLTRVPLVLSHICGHGFWTGFGPAECLHGFLDLPWTHIFARPDERLDLNHFAFRLLSRARTRSTRLVSPRNIL
jgi:hypothetical protein